MEIVGIKGWLLELALALLVGGGVGGAEKMPAPAAGFTPAEGATVELLQPQQAVYLAAPRKERVRYFANVECRKQLAAGGWWPLPVAFSWDAVPGAEKYVLTLARDAACAQPVATLTVTEPQAEVGNLRIATPYYWKVVAMTAEGEKTSPVHGFVTSALAPRLLRIDGVPNVRDLGGRLGLDGRRVRQDLVFRTAGMNDNAKAIYMEGDEAMRADPQLATQMQKTKERLARFEDIVADKAAAVPYALSREWTVFQPEKDKFTADDCQQAAALDAVPAAFMGAAGEKIVANGNGECMLSLIREWKPAVFVQEFAAADDGLMLLQVGADWYWQLAINGEVICDRTVVGNRKEVNQANHPLLLPVRKGRNVVSVVVMSGSAGWKWCCGALSLPNDDDRVNVGKAVARRVEQYFKDRSGIVKRYEPGRNRLSPEMKRYMLETLKIKSDIDLRSANECSGMTGSPLGETVTWFHISSSAYAGMASDFGRQAFTEVFKVFLDEKNYPIVFHCIAGQDRTGAVAFIINGLLGVAEEELWRDWEATGFWNRDVDFSHHRRFDKLVEVFAPLPGDTMNAKIENYVLSLGFTKDDIAKLRAIMLEPAAK